MLKSFKHIDITVWWYFTPAVGTMLLTGTTHGISALKYYGGFLLALTGLIHILIILVTGAYKSVRVKTLSFRTFRFPVISSIILFLICLYISISLDTYLDSKTQQTGDNVFAELQEYVQLHGSCPDAITEIELYKNGMPKTFFLGSKFQYQKNTASECRISYDAYAFFWCSKSTDPKYNTWYCTD